MSWYRISSADYPQFSGIGAALFGGRWTSPGNRAVYCGQSLSTCRLELLSQLFRSKEFPRSIWRKIDIPSNIDVLEIDVTALPNNWNDLDDVSACRIIGDEWYDSGKYLGLIVPSVPAGGDRNLIINETHADFSMLNISAAFPLTWDKRLFPLAMLA